MQAKAEEAAVLARIADALERLAPPAPELPDLTVADGFVWQGETGHLTPVAHVAALPLDLLKGINRSRDTLLANTERFAKGFAANNALLWGARGQGKSSLVKAVHAHCAGHGGEPRLKLIEIHREDIATLPSLLSLLRTLPQRVILFCDDLSFDAGETTYKSLKAALEGGLKGVIITCHCPLPDNHSDWVRMRPDQYGQYHEMIAEAREEYAGRVDVRAGLESDYFPGVEPWLEELHARQPLNHVLGSIHPQLPEYQDIYYNGDGFAFQRTYFDHLAQAAETGLFDTLAHPDLIKNLAGPEWSFALIQPHIIEALDRIAVTGVAMELNTSGRYKAVPEMNPGKAMLRLMCERGIPVVVGADAHVPERVGEGYRGALQVLEEVGYAEVSFFLERRRHALSIADALASLDISDEVGSG